MLPCIFLRFVYARMLVVYLRTPVSRDHAFSAISVVYLSRFPAFRVLQSGQRRLLPLGFLEHSSKLGFLVVPITRVQQGSSIHGKGGR